MYALPLFLRSESGLYLLHQMKRSGAALKRNIHGNYTRKLQGDVGERKRERRSTKAQYNTGFRRPESERGENAKMKSKN